MIQAGLDEVAKLPMDEQGFRGAVELKTGTYRLVGMLTMHESGVVLKAARVGAEGKAVLPDSLYLAQLRGSAWRGGGESDWILTGVGFGIGDVDAVVDAGCAEDGRQGSG
jgi:hypothetical protein